MLEVKPAEPRPPSFTATLGMLWIGALLAWAGIHAAAGDALLWHSDAWSLAVYFGAVGLALIPPTALAAGLTVVARRVAPKLFRGLHALYTLVLVAAILATFLLSAAPILGGAVGRWLAGSGAASLGAALAICLALAERQRLTHRVERLSQIALAATIVCVPAMIAWNHLVPRRADATAEGPDAPQKHLVVLVLDRLPAHMLRAYNPKADASPWDDVLGQSHLLTDLWTVAPYTHRFFGSLYTGRFAPRAGGPASIPNGSLPGALERGGVRMRWITDHRNGTPEGSEAQARDYRGLRSLLLTEKYAWLPRWLGLDYCVLLHMQPKPLHGGRQFWRDIPHYLNGRDVLPYDNVLVECLLPQLREMRRRGGPTMTLFHAGWRLAIRNRLARPERRGHKALRDSPDLSPDYRYDAALAERVAAERRATVDELASAGQSVAEFLAELRADPTLRDTAVLLIADHGCMYEKGRLYYVYHPNDEAIRVIGALFTPDGKPRIDGRFFSTPDLAASILDYFGLEYADAAGAQSVFADGAGRWWCPSLTSRNNTHNEWWLVLVGKQTKYAFNVHPHGKGQAMAFRTHTYDDVETPLVGEGYRRVGPPREAIPAIRAALVGGGASPEWIGPTETLLRQHAIDVGVGRDIEPMFLEAARLYGLRAADVHPAYRAVLQQGGQP